jgi:hypothetical protein
VIVGYCSGKNEVTPEFHFGSVKDYCSSFLCEVSQITLYQEPVLWHLLFFTLQLSPGYSHYVRMTITAYSLIKALACCTFYIKKPSLANAQRRLNIFQGGILITAHSLLPTALYSLELQSKAAKDPKTLG